MDSPDIPARSRVVSVGSSHITVEAITSVTGVCHGALPTSAIEYN